MMMGEKSKKKQYMLQELLSEEQEPFLLNTYISQKQIMKKRPTTTTSTTSTSNSYYSYSQTNTALLLQLQLQLQLQHKSCFLSSDSPVPALHITKSPILEAALRIHRHYSAKQNDNRFGTLGSFFKRLITQRGTTKKKRHDESTEDCAKQSSSNVNNNNKKKKVKDILKVKDDDVAVEEESSDDEVGFTCSSSGRCDCFHHHHHHVLFCQTPFRFSLHQNPTSSSAQTTPEFPSPPSPPTRSSVEVKEISNNGEDSIKKFQSKEEEEDEKEQCSPVSVLDPPFEDDDDGNDYEEASFDDLDRSYANIQRTKQQLLQRLLRFEELAELDPLELEKRMPNQEGNAYEKFIDEEEEYEDDNNEASYEEKDLRDIVHAILRYSSLCGGRRRVPEDLRRLVYDLITEEEIKELDSSEDRDVVMERVCRRLELWEEVNSNTIDMMVDEDFSREEGLWKKNVQHAGELVRELELVIFGFLVEEFAEELGS